MENEIEYFDHDAAVKQLYFTSDGLSFFEEQNAIKHARGLIDDTVTQMTEDEVDKALADITEDNWEEDKEYDPLDDQDAE